MRKCTHESPELNALLGKQVRLTFFDGDVVSGILEKDEWHKSCYHIRGARRVTFYKSHITKIEKIN
ncbi:MAG: hypothetical protein IJX16_03795 [Clostridia bacterium]|nr:hypothetical protein [Clostridia bacterium]